jgi:hypothetical protein
MATKYTKEEIKTSLANDPRWIERGLIVLYERQTMDEQETEETRHENGVGFNSSDARYLTYCSKFVLSGQHLSGKHLEKVKRMLPKYWKQILTLIQEKAKNEVVRH